jgi:hypothetical protein
MFRLILILALAAGALYLGKPSAADVDALIAEKLHAAILADDVERRDDPAAMLLLELCRADAGACTNLVQSLIRTRYRDRTLFAQVDLEGFGREATCYAALTKLYCPETPWAR